VQGRVSDTILGEDGAGGQAVQAELVRHLHGKDRMISPELERFMADRMKAKTIEVKATLPQHQMLSRTH
jgi:hypothetical protein